MKVAGGERRCLFLMAGSLFLVAGHRRPLWLVPLLVVLFVMWQRPRSFGEVVVVVRWGRSVGEVVVVGW